jgi:tripartite-type tricarboxylate transporter receptor subunit TctC
LNRRHRFAQTQLRLATDAVFGPTGVPEEIVAHLHGEIARALGTAAVRERLAAIGVAPGGDTPDHTQAFMLSEIERWARVIKETGIKTN